MSSDYWTEKSVINALLQARTLINRITIQGKESSKLCIYEMIQLLEEIMLQKPETNEVDVNIQGMKCIVALLHKLLANDNNNDVSHMESESHDIALIPSFLPNTFKFSNVSNETVTNVNKQDEFDSFSAARKKAIEDTIVDNIEKFFSFSDIAGLQDAKNAIIEAVVDPINYPDYFKQSDIKPWKSVLLYGPPGTGKTTLSQAVAKRINGVLYQISSSDLISSWQGQSEKLIKELFEHAFKQEKAVIFIDEVDSLCRTRCRNEDDANRRVKTELLVQIQRLHTTTDIILICATNCPWELDPAFLRRLEKRIYAGLPDEQARWQILQANLGNTKLESTVGLQYLAQNTVGFNGDDLRLLASELAYTQFRKYKTSNSELETQIILTADDVEQVLEKFQPSVHKEQLTLYQEFMYKR